MSHASCLVVGSNPDKMLKPYDENTSVDPYKEYMTDEDISSMREHYEKKQNCKLVNEELRNFMQDWNNSDGEIDKQGMFYWKTYNPDSKWDWYELGGRYPRRLILKKGCKGERGKYHYSYTGQFYHGENTRCARCRHEWKDDRPNSEIKECPKCKSKDWKKYYLPNEFDSAKVRDITKDCLAKLSTFAIGGWKLSYKKKLIKATHKYYKFDGKIFQLKKGNMFVSDPNLDGIEFFPEKTWDIHYHKYLKDLHPDTIISLIDFHI